MLPFQSRWAFRVFMIVTVPFAMPVSILCSAVDGAVRAARADWRSVKRYWRMP